MSLNTKIEWADSTFNPWIGCTRISPACDHCYAAVSTPARTRSIEWGPGKPRIRTSEANWREPAKWNRQHDEFYESHGRRRRVFCASLADVFDNEVDTQWRADLFGLITLTPNLIWMLLTKRIGNVPQLMQEITEPGKPWKLPDNVWLGATIANQEEADRDIPKLLATPARVRFLSCEPLLGPLDLTVFPRPPSDYDEAMPGFAQCRGFFFNALDGSDGFLNHDGHAWESAPGVRSHIDWIITGGESGLHARPAHPEWFRSLRDQCTEANVPFFFKQSGEFVSVSEVAGPGEHFEFPDGATVRRAGKKLAGRTLDGRTWDEVPSCAT